MAITKEKKAEILKRVEGAFADAGSVVFVGANKLTVAEVSGLRTKLKSQGVSYYVAKKTLIRRVLDDRKFEGTVPELPGEIAIAWGQDLIAPAREIYDFAKTHKEQMSIVGGVFEGRFMDAAAMTGIATIPSRQTLYAMFVNVINSPIQGLAVALDQIAQKKNA